MLNSFFKMDLVHGGDVLLYGTALGDSVWLAWCGGCVGEGKALLRSGLTYHLESVREFPPTSSYFEWWAVFKGFG